MSPTPSSRPLDDSELDRLDQLLQQADPEESMLIEELDGFFAGLACCPVTIERRDWLGQVLGSTRSPSEVSAELLDLLERHRRAVREALAARQGLNPILGFDPQGEPLAHAWSIGFVRAMALKPEVWEALEADETYADSLAPLMELVEEAEGLVDTGDSPDWQDAEETEETDDTDDTDDTDGSPEAENSSEARRERLHRLFDAVQDVYGFFHPTRPRGGGAPRR